MRDATARGGQNSTDIQSKIPSEFVVLAEAFNTAIKSANRTWLIAVSLSIVAIGAAADDGNGVFYYSRFSDVNFFASLALALSVVNLDLCAAHSNMYEAQAVYHGYLKDIGASAKLASTSVTLKDVAHRLSVGAYNRFFPILFAFREESRKKIMNNPSQCLKPFIWAYQILGCSLR